MSQRRRSLSIAPELYESAKAFAEEHGISLSQLISQGIRAVIEKRIPLEPPRSAAEIGMETRRRRGTSAPVAAVAPSIALAVMRTRRVDLDRVLSRVVTLPLSAELTEDVVTAASRCGAHPDAQLDVAITRMLDHLAQVPWCRDCLQTIGDCGCRRPAMARRA